MVASAVPNAISPASCSTSTPLIRSVFSFVRRLFFSLLLFPKIANLSHGNCILPAAVRNLMCSASTGSVTSMRRISAPVSSLISVIASLRVSMSLFEYVSSSGGASSRSANGLERLPRQQEYRKRERRASGICRWRQIGGVAH